MGCCAHSNGLFNISFTRSKAISILSVTELFNTLFRIVLAIYSVYFYCGVARFSKTEGLGLIYHCVMRQSSLLILEMYKLWLVQVFSAYRKEINISFVIDFIYQL